MKFGLFLCGRQTQRQIIPSYTPHLCTAFEPLRERCGRHGQHYEREQQRTNGWDDTHCASFCLIILGLPGDALLLRVTWMERHDFRTKRNAHFCLARKQFCYDLLISELLRLINNAHNEFAADCMKEDAQECRS
jgi:hypothetical protein